MPRSSSVSIRAEKLYKEAISLDEGVTAVFDQLVLPAVREAAQESMSTTIESSLDFLAASSLRELFLTVMRVCVQSEPERSKFSWTAVADEGVRSKSWVTSVIPPGLFKLTTSSAVVRSGKSLWSRKIGRISKGTVVRLLESVVQGDLIRGKIEFPHENSLNMHGWISLHKSNETFAVTAVSPRETRKQAPPDASSDPGEGEPECESSSLSRHRNKTSPRGTGRRSQPGDPPVGATGAAPDPGSRKETSPPDVAPRLIQAKARIAAAASAATAARIALGQGESLPLPRNERSRPIETNSPQLDGSMRIPPTHDQMKPGGHSQASRSFRPTRDSLSLAKEGKKRNVPRFRSTLVSLDRANAIGQKPAMDFASWMSAECSVIS